MTGRFVVVEGGDGSGKSTQSARLVAALQARGTEVVATVEPGGTPLGRELRRLLLDGGSVDARAEALLMAADRAEHVATVVRPALARGAWVVSDRHVPSSLVYQGVVRGLGVDAVAALSSFATDGVVPDLVVVLDVDDATAESRRTPGEDRLEREGREFHAAVRGRLPGPGRPVRVDRGRRLRDPRRGHGATRRAGPRAARTVTRSAT